MKKWKKMDRFEKKECLNNLGEFIIISIVVVLLLTLMVHEMCIVHDGSSSHLTDALILQKRSERRVTDYSNRLQKKPYITIQEFKILVQKADNLATRNRNDVVGLYRDLSGDYIEKLAKKYDYTNLVDGDDGHVYKVHCYKTGTSKSDTLELKFTLSAVNNGKLAQIDPNWQKAHEKGK